MAITVSRRQPRKMPPMRRDDRTVLIVCNHFGTQQAAKGAVKIAQLTIFGFNSDTGIPAWDIKIFTRAVESEGTLGGPGKAWRFTEGPNGRLHRTWRLSCDRCSIDAVATDRILYEKVTGLRDTGMSPVLLAALAASLSSNSS